MAILAREGEPNTIMRIAIQLGHLELEHLDPDREAYETWEDALRAHRGGKDEAPSEV